MTHSVLQKIGSSTATNAVFVWGPTVLYAPNVRTTDIPILWAIHRQTCSNNQERREPAEQARHPNSSDKNSIDNTSFSVSQEYWSLVLIIALTYRNSESRRSVFSSSSEEILLLFFTVGGATYVDKFTVKTELRPFPTINHSIIRLKASSIIIGTVFNERILLPSECFGRRATSQHISPAVQRKSTLTRFED